MPREMLSWALVSVTLGAVEGGVLGVLVKNAYADSAPETWINFAVALVSGAPAFANLISFGFSTWARGRNKVQLISRLLLLFSSTVLLIALVPRTQLGLLLLVPLTIIARMLWSASITLRATVWRANFPRHVRARITGKMTTLSSLLIAICSASLGWLMDINLDYARILWCLAGLSGLIAALVYRNGRIRHHRHILKLEKQAKAAYQGINIVQFFHLLRDDKAFAQYMQAMFIFGSGNLMLTAPLIILLNEQFGLSRLIQVVITASLPLLLLSVSIPFWARQLDNSHIIQYRAKQSWGFVLAIGCFAMACIFNQPWLLWLGGGALGIAYGGGVLGWNLGHNDFSKDHHSELYMGVHVTLTGIRGLIMPAIGVMVYQLLESWQSGGGRYSLLLPLSLSFTGATAFVMMAARQRRTLTESEDD